MNLSPHQIMNPASAFSTLNNSWNEKLWTWTACFLTFGWIYFGESGGPISPLGFVCGRVKHMVLCTFNFSGWDLVLSMKWKWALRNLYRILGFLVQNKDIIHWTVAPHINRTFEICMIVLIENGWTLLEIVRFIHISSSHLAAEPSTDWFCGDLCHFHRTVFLKRMVLLSFKYL